MVEGARSPKRLVVLILLVHAQPDYMGGKEAVDAPNERYQWPPIIFRHTHGVV